jgi:hypothetical protein
MQVIIIVDHVNRVVVMETVMGIIVDLIMCVKTRVDIMDQINIIVRINVDVHMQKIVMQIQHLEMLDLF